MDGAPGELRRPDHRALRARACSDRLRAWPDRQRPSAGRLRARRGDRGPARSGVAGGRWRVGLCAADHGARRPAARRHLCDCGGGLRRGAQQPVLARHAGRVPGRDGRRGAARLPGPAARLGVRGRGPQLAWARGAGSASRASELPDPHRAERPPSALGTAAQRAAAHRPHARHPRPERERRGSRAGDRRRPRRATGRRQRGQGPRHRLRARHRGLGVGGRPRFGGDQRTRRRG